MIKPNFYTLAVLKVCLGYLLCLAFSWPVYAHTIAGGVEHAEKLSNIGDKFKVGKVFEDRLVTRAASGNWFEIPAWLAGTWQSIQVVQLSSYDSKTGQSDNSTIIIPANETETFGYQIDNRQSIWTIKQGVVPLVHGTEIANPEPDKKPPMIPVTKYTLRESSLIDISEKGVTLKSLDVIITVRSDNKGILDVEQREVLRTFCPIQAGVLAVTSDAQIYDRFGFPLTRVKAAEFRKQVRDFKVLDESKGASLYASFKNFLQESGKLSLAPVRN